MNKDINIDTNQKDYPYKLTPFKLAVLQNFPYIEADFDALTDYGLLCKVVEYLNNVIANQNVVQENVTALNNAFTELKNYIDTYFDVELTERVDAKLNEFAENGTLEQMIAKYISNRFARTYNTVADMKSDTGLIAGMYVNTLGYYNINIGSAKYFISDNVTENDLYEILDNNKYAILQFDNNLIDVNAVGADNTATNDSSDIFNKVFKYINTRFCNNLFDINTVLTNGSYRIDKQIEMPPFAKMTGSGYTIFLTNVNGTSAFWIHYLSSKRPTNFPGNKLQYQYANLIDYPLGCLFKNVDGKLQNDCIEIGEHSDLGTNYNVSRTKLCNFSIQNYNIGLHLNVFNVFISNFERLQIETNNICCEFSTNNQIRVNAGEHILFDNCLLSGAKYCFLWKTPGFDLEVVNSSLDFNEYVVSDPFAKGYHKIAISNSHIEGNNHLVGTMGFPNLINIINNRILLMLDGTNKNELVTYNDADSSVDTSLLANKGYLYLLNNYINITKSQEIGTTNPEFSTYNSYINIIDIDNIYQDANKRSFINNGNLLKGLFDDLEDGNITITTGNSYANNNYLTTIAKQNLKDTAKVVTDNYLYDGHKSLVIYKGDSTTTQANLNIKTSLFLVKKHIYTASWYSFNKKTGGSMRFNFYDKDGNKISNLSAYQYNPNLPVENNKWYISNYVQTANVPEDAVYFNVEFYLGNWNNNENQAEDTEYKIGGLIIN